MSCRAEQWAEMIMASELSYSTIEKEPFLSFIEKEVGYKLPSESSIRKTYADVVVGKRERKMMEILTGKDLYDVQCMLRLMGLWTSIMNQWEMFWWGI